MDVLNQFKKVSDQLEQLGVTMAEEERVMTAELRERQKLGLTGEDAVKHYNDWMNRAGMPHLRVPDDE